MNTIIITVTEQFKLKVDPNIILNKGSYGVDKIHFDFLAPLSKEDFVTYAVLKLNRHTPYNVFLDANNDIIIPKYATYESGACHISLRAVIVDTEYISIDDYKEIMSGSPQVREIESYLQGRNCSGCEDLEKAVITTNDYKFVVE